MEKRYYWMKLKEDFFSTTRLKKLRKVPGGVHMSNEEYKQIIIELVREVEDQQILISIYTVVKNLTK